MAGEVLFFLAPSCSLGSKLPLLHYSLSFMLFCPNKGRRGGSELSSPAGCRAVGSCYYPGAGWPWRGRRPLLCSQLHLHSPSLNNLTCCTSLPFTIYLHWSYFQSKALHKGKKALFSYVFFFFMSYLELQGTLVHTSQDNEDKKRRDLSK